MTGGKEASYVVTVIDHWHVKSLNRGGGSGDGEETYLRSKLKRTLEWNRFGESGGERTKHLG